MIVNCVLWSHKLRNYAAMNIFYAFNHNKILHISEGMRVDIETISSLEKKLHLNSNLMVNVNWLYLKQNPT